MSAVLMCDNCGQLFSVNEKGWRELSERVPASESNSHNQGVRVHHTGPCCVLRTIVQSPMVKFTSRELETGSVGEDEE